MGAHTQDIAIVIPAYNAAGTIAETLVSIQNQQGGLARVLKVVVCDDASRDNTAQVAQTTWTSPVPLFLSVNEKNQGERSTVNNAVVTLAESVQWFFILHADDIAKAHWLTRMLECIDQADQSVGSVTASYDVLHPDNRVEPGEQLDDSPPKIIEGTPAAVAGTLRNGCWWKISSCAIRRRTFDDLGGFKTDMPQLGDLDFLLRLLAAGSSVAYLPTSLSIYRQTATSVSSASFQVHRDVREWLVILDRFGCFLTRPQRLARFVFLLGLLARRIVRCLLHWHHTRMAEALRLIPRVIIQSALSLLSSTPPVSQHYRPPLDHQNIRH